MLEIINKKQNINIDSTVKDITLKIAYWGFLTLTTCFWVGYNFFSFIKDYLCIVYVINMKYS